MSKKFLSNVSILLLINLLVKPFWILGVDRMVQNTVGNEAYGNYIVLFNTALLFTMLLDFGINNYISTVIAQNRNLLQKKFSALFSLKLVFSLGYLVLTFLWALFYGIQTQNFLLLLVLALNQVATFFIMYFRANIAGLQLFKTDAVLSVMDRGMMILVFVVYVFLLQGNITIKAFITVQSIGYVLSLCVAFFVLKPHLGHIKITFERILLLALVKKAWPYALLAFVMVMYTRTDYLLVKKILFDGDVQNGIYAAANRLLEAANMVGALVATMLLPLFAYMLKHKEDIGGVVKTSMIMLLFPAVMVVSFCWFYHEDIIHLLVRNHAAETAELFKYVMINFASMCLMYIFGTLLTANGNLKKLTWYAVIAIAINLIINVSLLPIIGIKAAVIASVCTHGFIAISNTYSAFTTIHIKLPYVFLRKFLFICAGIVLTTYLCVYLGMNMIIALIIVALYLILTSLFVRLITLKEIVSIVKRPA